MRELTEPPKLITESATPPARQQRLERLQGMISRRPGVFLRAFEQLGESMTAESYDISDERIYTVGISTEPEDLIREYFAKRDDRGVSMDKSSDDALMSDGKYRELRTRSSGTRSERVMTGTMRSTMRANPNADPARDEARRYMFGFYLKRAVAWSEQRAVQRKRLPSAG